MSIRTDYPALKRGFEGVKRVIWGSEDTRIRATWRVLLAGIVLVQIQEPLSVVFADLLGGGRLFFGISQAAVFAVLLLAWAAYIDRRPVSDYGFSLSGSWIADGIVGFVAVCVGFGAWLGLGSVMGWAEVTMAMTAPGGSVLLGLAAFLLAGVLNVWVQETTFVGMVCKNGAEGLSSRGVTATRAVLAAWLVSVLVFTLVHQPTAIGQVVNYLLVLGVYGLLYGQTGQLALPIGLHAGVNFVGGVLVVTPSIAAQRPSLFEVTNSLSGVLGSLNAGAVPQVLIAYVLVLGWLAFYRNDVSIATRLAHWTKR